MKLLLAVREEEEEEQIVLLIKRVRANVVVLQKKETCCVLLQNFCAFIRLFLSLSISQVQERKNAFPPWEENLLWEREMFLLQFSVITFSVSS